MMPEIAMSWEGPVGLDAEVAQLRRGDLDALAALLARYQNRLYRYLLRLVREPATAEDLFQQTWLRVAEKIRQYDAKRNFEAWLFSVARNLAIDYLRRIKPESLDESSPSGVPLHREPRSAAPPVLDGLVMQERNTRLGAALAELPVFYRDVLTLRFEEEMKLEEIAEVLGTPLSTVKTRLRRSLEGLRRTLETRYPGEDWLGSMGRVGR
jgi:RNA polymerase sigma-70 factor (ECF subfamily)